MNFFHLSLVALTLLAMEFIVTLVHKHVMHGFGWGWHQSHHVARRHAGLEKNDWYTVVFSIATMLLFVLGGTQTLLWWIGLGISIYGLLYGILHDLLVHRRIPMKWQAKNRYIKHLVTAHHLHHASLTRDSGVSFGFLYAPPLRIIRKQLRNGDSTT